LISRSEFRILDSGFKVQTVKAQLRDRGQLTTDGNKVHLFQPIGADSNFGGNAMKGRGLFLEKKEKPQT
jgi:hypothetical protein